MVKANKYVKIRAAGIRLDREDDTTHLGEEHQAAALVQVNPVTDFHHAPPPSPWKHIGDLAGDLLMRAKETCK